MNASLEILEKLPIEVIQDFQETGKSKSIPVHIQEYIVQLNSASEIKRVEHNISRAADLLKEKYPQISFETARQRIYDAINRFHLNNTVSKAAWENYYADRMEDAARTALTAFKNITEHRRCMEKAKDYRISASIVSIDPNKIKHITQLVSPEVTHGRLFIPEQNLKILWSDTKSYITKLPITEKEKDQAIKEARENLGEQIDHEEL